MQLTPDIRAERHATAVRRLNSLLAAPEAERDQIQIQRVRAEARELCQPRITAALARLAEMEQETANQTRGSRDALPARLEAADNRLREIKAAREALEELQLQHGREDIRIPIANILAGIQPLWAESAS